MAAESTIVSIVFCMLTSNNVEFIALKCWMNSRFCAYWTDKVHTLYIKCTVCVLWKVAAVVTVFIFVQR